MRCAGSDTCCQETNRTMARNGDGEDYLQKPQLGTSRRRARRGASPPIARLQSRFGLPIVGSVPWDALSGALGAIVLERRARLGIGSARLWASATTSQNHELRDEPRIQRWLDAMRATASARIAGDVARLSRTWPAPSPPKGIPELSATRPRSRKTRAGSSPNPNPRQSIQAR